MSAAVDTPERCLCPHCISTVLILAHANSRKRPNHVPSGAIPCRCRQLPIDHSMLILSTSQGGAGKPQINTPCCTC
jgi:hypothetical protein